MAWARRVWKYVVLGATSILGEEANPLWGGIGVRRGHWNFVAVVVAVAIGTWLASILLYYIGYAQIGWVQRRWPKMERLIESALGMVRRNPWRSALAVRFAFGLRLALPIACGAARMPFTLYVIATGISCWVWSLLFTYVGLVFGRTAMRALRFTERLDVKLGLAAALLVILLAIIMTYRRRLERDTTTTNSHDA